MRIFLTGASGLVGSNVAASAARRGHTVLGTTGAWDGSKIEGLTQSARLDLRDAAAVTSAVLEFFPDAIINAAAISSPAACEFDKEGSHALNVLLPLRLAELAHHLSCRFVHISSEQVHSGKEPPYLRDTPPTPINTYGRQKVESEELIRNAAPEVAASVRAPLLMGNSPRGARSVHERLFADWSAGRVVKLYTDEIRQPCTAENLADVLVELCERSDMTGVFQWGGAEALSRFELGLRIAHHFAIPTEGRIAPAALAGSPEAATRPANLTLDLTPLAGLLKTRVQTIEEQLETLHVPRAARSWWAALGAQ